MNDKGMKPRMVTPTTAKMGNQAPNYFEDIKNEKDDRGLLADDERDKPSSPRVDQAFALLKAFKTERNHWPHIKRKPLLYGLLDRIEKPDLIDQAGQNTCGVVAMLRAWALDSPVDYVSLALDLYGRGTGQLKGGKLGGARQITPSADLRSEKPPGYMDPADWILSASIRESLNSVFNYSAGEGVFHIKAYTTPGDVEMQFRRFGYSKVRNKASVVFSSQGYDSLMEASHLFRSGWRVLMLVHNRLIDGEAAGAVRVPNHWVGLASGIAPVLSAREPMLYGFKVWSWAKERPIPTTGDRIPLEKVIGNYFGFVAGRY